MKKIAKILQNKTKANGCRHILNPGLQSFVYMYYNRTVFMDPSIWYSLLSITNCSITPTEYVTPLTIFFKSWNFYRIRLNSKNNGPVLLFKDIFRNCFLSSVTKDLRKPKRDNPKIFWKSQKIFQIKIFFSKSLSKSLTNLKNYCKS